jgi:hypothetical protein
MPAGGGTWGLDARHHYSKDQPWNSDGTLIAMQNSGAPGQVFLDGANYTARFAECSQYDRGDDRWHPSPQHPHVRVNAVDDQLMWFDVMACTQLRSWTLPFAVEGGVCAADQAPKEESRSKERPIKHLARKPRWAAEMLPNGLELAFLRSFDVPP